jgi:thiol-disulfide isomerase/thioredoxin
MTDRRKPDDRCPTRQPAERRLSLIALGALCGVAVGLAAVYGIGAMQRNPTEPAAAPSASWPSALAPLARGEVAAVNIASSPNRLPDLAFNDPSGKPVTLADFRGRTVLLNLWATWCVPCRKEMPALDALQAKLGGDKFQVVAVNIDTRNPRSRRYGSTRLASGSSGITPTPAPRCFRISRRPAKPSACRPRC